MILVHVLHNLMKSRHKQLFWAEKEQLQLTGRSYKLLWTAFRDKTKVKLPSYVAQNIATEQNTRLIIQRVQVTWKVGKILLQIMKKTVLVFQYMH